MVKRVMSNRLSFTLISFAIIVFMGAVVFAFNSPHDPSVMGHTLGEIEACGNGQILKTVDGTWSCVEESDMGLITAENVGAGTFKGVGDYVFPAGGDVRVDNNLNIGDDLNVDEDANIGGSLNVEKDLKVRGTIYPQSSIFDGARLVCKDGILFDQTAFTCKNIALEVMVAQDGFDFQAVRKQIHVLGMPNNNALTDLYCFMLGGTYSSDGYSHMAVELDSAIMKYHYIDENLIFSNDYDGYWTGSTDWTSYKMIDLECDY